MDCSLKNANPLLKGRERGLRLTAHRLDVLSQLLHLLLLYDEILPVEHLHLRFILSVLEQREQIVDFLVNGIFLHNYVVLFL